MRTRSVSRPRPHRSSSFYSVCREVFRVLADTRIIILFLAEETFFQQGPAACIAKLETRDVFSRLNWSLFLSSSCSFRRALRGTSSNFVHGNAMELNNLLVRGCIIIRYAWSWSENIDIIAFRTLSRLVHCNI